MNMNPRSTPFELWFAGVRSNPCRTIHPKRALRCHVLLLSLLGCSFAAQAQRYVKICAEIALTGYRTDDTDAATTAKPRIISVLCITGTNQWGIEQWRIEQDWIQNGLSKWFFDGTNVYESLQATSPLPQETQALMKRLRGPAIVPFEIARSNLTINIWPSTDGNPLGDQGVNIPWLAFCSGTYLKRPGRLVPLPVEVLRHTRDRFAYKDKTKTFNDALGLPRRIDLYLSKSLFVRSETEFDQEYFFGDRYTESIQRRVATLPEGARFFHFKVTESTNFLGWVFPTKFEFFQNGRKFEQNGDWFWRGIGMIKSISSSAKPDGLFVPTMQQTVADARFREPTASMNAIIYTWSNSFAAPTNDPFLQHVFEKRVARMKEPPTLPECSIRPATAEPKPDFNPK